MNCAAAKPLPPVLRLCGVGKTYARSRGLFRRAEMVCAVEDVSLTLPSGSTAAIIGQSGAGKSTLARCIAGLESLTSGEIYFGADSAPTKRCRGALARQVQLIFQDSATALNPRFSAAEIIGEPLVIQGASRSEVKKNVAQLIDAVGLPRDIALRRPLQLSGGQRQRLAIARALAVHPSLLLLDEAFSGLDLFNQTRILDLLARLQQQFALTYLLISHDLRLVAKVADVIAIMHQGRIVEQGAARSVVHNPQHAQTRALLAAIPGRDLTGCRS